MWTEKQVHFILLLVDQFGYTLMTLHDQASSTPARALPAEADFLPPLQRDRKVSLERQLVQALRAAIVSGRLRPGMRLPSSRCLAAELHINRNTIVNALEQLIAEDYLTGKVGAGTFVNHHLMVSSPVPMPSPSIEHARLATPHPGTTGSPRQPRTCSNFVSASPRRRRFHWPCGGSHGTQHCASSRQMTTARSPASQGCERLLRTT
jgi:DNA-binding transcriptional regulator YhcF (GntR family)